MMLMLCDNQAVVDIMQDLLDNPASGGGRAEMLKRIDGGLWLRIRSWVRRRRTDGQGDIRITWIPGHTLGEGAPPKKLQQKEDFLAAGGNIDQLRYNQLADALADTAHPDGKGPWHPDSYLTHELSNACEARRRLASICQKMYTHIWGEHLPLVRRTRGRHTLL